MASSGPTWAVVPMRGRSAAERERSGPGWGEIRTGVDVGWGEIRTGPVEIRTGVDVEREIRTGVDWGGVGGAIRPGSGLAGK